MGNLAKSKLHNNKINLLESKATNFTGECFKFQMKTMLNVLEVAG